MLMTILTELLSSRPAPTESHYTYIDPYVHKRIHRSSESSASFFLTMFKASLFVVSLIVCLISPSTIAAPASETVSPTFKRDFHCANGVDECPTGWTCCGPIISGVGGNCRQLGKGEVCPLKYNNSSMST
ncbi:hypothetical protein H2248_005280 [Termitomyces sp. 'cryptogamus']|nr:hypothetical protein H2248_005280 [Termitomyces sp. 'cryptogamus']